MNWTEFVSACNQFVSLSEEYGDSWRAEGDAANPSEFFISLRTLRSDGDCGDGEPQKNCGSSRSRQSSSSAPPLTCRFDIVYSMSYSVPVMYFKMSKNDGSSLTIEEIWKLTKVSSEDLWSTVSQADHPILQIPFYTFHACQTEKFLESLCSSEEPKNANIKLKPYEFLLSWLSFMASILQFHFSPQYILHSSKNMET